MFGVSLKHIGNMASLATARWQTFVKLAQDYARGAVKRFGAPISDDEAADIALDAVADIFGEDSDDDGWIKQEIAKKVANAVRQKKRENARTRYDGIIVSMAESRIDGSAKSGSALGSGKGKRLRCLVKGAANAWTEAFTAPPGEWAPAASQAETLRLEARELGRELEWHTAAIEDAIQGGGIWRLPEYERGIYTLLVASIAKHARVPLQDGKVVDALVEWRRKHIEVRCDLCAPGSRWIICKHTIPEFDDHGRQVGGTDLRVRGRRKHRPNLRFKFGGRAAIDAQDVSPANYNDTYLQRDAAGSIVSEALRQYGIDSSVRHIMAEERRLELRDQIEKFLKELHSGPDGELIEVSPKIVAPGAQRKRKRAIR